MLSSPIGFCRAMPPKALGQPAIGMRVSGWKLTGSLEVGDGSYGKLLVASKGIKQGE